MLGKLSWQCARFAALLAGLVATNHACDCGCALTIATASSTLADTVKQKPFPAVYTIMHAPKPLHHDSRRLLDRDHRINQRASSVSHLKSVQEAALEALEAWWSAGLLLGHCHEPG